jgi:hypothetical protein
LDKAADRIRSDWPLARASAGKALCRAAAVREVREVRGFLFLAARPKKRPRHSNEEGAASH